MNRIALATLELAFVLLGLGGRAECRSRNVGGKTSG